MIQLLLLKDEQDWNGCSHLQSDGLSLAGETLVVLGLTGAIRLPREGSGTAQSSQVFRHSTTGLCPFVNKRRGAWNGEMQASLSSPLHRWMDLDGVLSVLKNKQTPDDQWCDAEVLLTVANSPLPFALYFKVSGQTAAIWCIGGDERGALAGWPGLSLV